MTKVNTSFPKVQAAAQCVNGFEQVNEGIFLTAAELQNVESTLETSEGLQAALDAANATVQAKETEITNANATIATLNAKVAELEAQDGTTPAAPAATAADGFEGGNVNAIEMDFQKKLIDKLN
jgi:multidrug resistance efflux pump